MYEQKSPNPSNESMIYKILLYIIRLIKHISYANIILFKNNHIFYVNEKSANKLVNKFM